MNFKVSLGKIPLLRILFPLLLGMVSSVFYPSQNAYLFPVTIALFIFLFFFTFIRALSSAYKLRVYYGFLLHLFLFFSGYSYTSLRTEKFNPQHISNSNIEKGLVLAIIEEVPVEKNKVVKTIIEVSAVHNEGEWISASGKALVYFEKDSFSTVLQMGDRIIFEPFFKNVDGPKNPSEFDYRKYLAFHQVHQQIYLKTGTWRQIGSREEWGIFKIASSFRIKLLNVFSEYGIKDKEFAVASALILGCKDKLDNEIIRAYSGAGAMHVLAVSGLHVGIIYMVFNTLLFFLDRFRYGFIFKAGILILLLWGYAMLTGLSPSVLRAATMFSFVIAGRAFKRNGSIFNSMAASAILLLMVNPYIIMEVGFQLSYLAVAGIVLVQPGIYHLFYIRDWTLDKVWQLTSVSIAAQLATFPLGLLYFHQFPNYFLLSNLIVIPGATVIVYLGVLLLFVSGISLIAVWVAKFFSFMVYILNFLVMNIEKFPYSITEGIFVSVAETWMIYLFLSAIIVFFFSRKKEWLMAGLSLFALFMVLRIPTVLSHYKQKKIIVYNVSGHTAIDFIEGRDHYLISDEILSSNIEKQRFHLKNNWIKSGMKNEASVPLKNLYESRGYFQFFDKKIAVIGKEIDLKGNPTKKLSVDFIIVTGNARVRPAEILSNFDAKLLILDSSFPEGKANKVKEEFEKHKLLVHSVRKDGYWQFEI
jgi:competence protein ComEC